MPLRNKFTKGTRVESEIYSCLHKNMDALNMQNIVDSQFKRLTKKTIDFLETCCKKRWITGCLDFITAHEWLAELLNIIKRLVKIELQYLDIMKDSFLAYSLYQIVGGNQAIWDFPTEFSIVVVLCLAASVVLPVVFATLHLIVYNPYIFFTTPSNQEASVWRRALMTLVFLLLSVLNPIFLVNSYERFKEKTRKMAKTMDKNTMQQMKATRAIKDQWTAFVRIELGNE